MRRFVESPWELRVEVPPALVRTRLAEAIARSDLLGEVDDVAYSVRSPLPFHLKLWSRWSGSPRVSGSIEPSGGGALLRGTVGGFERVVTWVVMGGFSAVFLLAVPLALADGKPDIACGAVLGVGLFDGITWLDYRARESHVLERLRRVALGDAPTG